jgi:hypothetical protein
MKKSSPGPPGTEGGAKTDVLTSRFHITYAGGQSTETIDRLLLLRGVDNQKGSEYIKESFFRDARVAELEDALDLGSSPHCG